ncbi:translesion error-prone DNA polymerase V autoproteolytic subunit [Herbaspirillum seropedicae]|uniref:LexA family protein n=1 Tax=Herbaspirillum seropedicae TaxID=964 RepID=UPI00111E2CE3|nr:translesion error-prone DNA polymerase V autoproteolytic subunit [Herbaspirillum seropedicae]QDD66646.1 translesion error-prone DNA polymerase V autoproteolytic subunit [Herbaspirillum seropedicae]
MAIDGALAPYLLGCHQLPISAATFYEQSFATHILQKISAGFPSPAQDYEASELDLNKYLVQRTNCTFFFTAAGDSMKNAGIFDGDKIVVDRSIEARPGMIVVAIVNSDFTLKWLRYINGAYELHPDNPDYEPIRFADGEELRVFGVMVGIARRFKWA